MTNGGDRGEVVPGRHEDGAELRANGKIDGLRIDHPDGLYDPEQYFRRLQQRYAQLGATVVASTPARLAAHLKAEIDRWGPIIKAAGIKADG